MYLRAIKTKPARIVGTVGCNIGSYWNFCFEQLAGFQYLRRKGGKFYHRGGAATGPATQLRMISEWNTNPRGGVPRHIGKYAHC